MLDINEIAKEMTREEFLNSRYVRTCCPTDAQLENCHKCMGHYEQLTTVLCFEGWKKAIENIRFKDDMEENAEINTETKIIKETIKEVTKNSKEYTTPEITAMLLKDPTLIFETKFSDGKVWRAFSGSDKSYVGIGCIYGYKSDTETEDFLTSDANTLSRKWYLVEKFYFYLEEALSVARTDRLQVKHKDWDNFVPVDDLMANIVFLIKDNKLDAAELNRRVWEVK